MRFKVLTSFVSAQGSFCEGDERDSIEFGPSLNDFRRGRLIELVEPKGPQSVSASSGGKGTGSKPAARRRKSGGRARKAQTV